MAAQPATALRRRAAVGTRRVAHLSLLCGLCERETAARLPPLAYTRTIHVWKLYEKNMHTYYTGMTNLT